jgi:opacity protein-like surface antigen
MPRSLMTGLAAGGGIEVAVTPNLTFKAEYLYLDFPAKIFLSGTRQNSPADERIQTVRAGMNWLFH